MAPMTPQEMREHYKTHEQWCLVKCGQCEERLPEPPWSTPWGIYLLPVVIGSVLAVLFILGSRL